MEDPRVVRLDSVSLDREARVIMLPSDKGRIVQNRANNDLLTYYKNPFIQNGTLVPQHLYFILDKRIKPGDWVYDYAYNKVGKYNGHRMFGGDFSDHCWSIVASTDPELVDVFNSVAKIKDSFVQLFVREQGTINLVNLACERVLEYKDHHNSEWVYRLKLEDGEAIVTGIHSTAIVKNSSILMLKSNKSSKLFKVRDEIAYRSNHSFKEGEVPYHLYFTSDVPVEVGDWGECMGSVFQYLSGDNSHLITKVVATTDPDLWAEGLARIDSSFVQDFTWKQGCITSVGLEYEKVFVIDTIPGETGVKHRLRVNPDKTVRIRNVESSLESAAKIHAGLPQDFRPEKKHNYDHVKVAKYEAFIAGYSYKNTRS